MYVRIIVFNIIIVSFEKYLLENYFCTLIEIIS